MISTNKLIQHISIICCTVLFVSCSNIDPKSNIKLPSLVSSNMVLQRNAEVNVWGYANTGHEITVTESWSNTEVATKTDEEGKWSLKLKTPEAGGPYTLSIKATDTLITLDNILIGDVWICSGQSNMEWTMEKAQSAEEELPLATNTNIRLFKVDRSIRVKPTNYCGGEWKVCSPENVKEFSAPGYFFGKELTNELNIPIGLIGSYWGGTPSEAWTSGEALSQFEAFTESLQELKGSSNINIDSVELLRNEVDAAKKKIGDFKNEENIGYREKWYTIDYDDSDWKLAEVPKEWSTTEIGTVEGAMWMRKKVTIPESWKGKDLILSLGQVDEMDETWFNETSVGVCDEIPCWDDYREYTIAANDVKVGENTITIRIVNTYGEGGLFSTAETVKIYVKGNEQEAISLAGNDWKYKIAYRFPLLPKSASPRTASVLYNGMISPLLNVTIKGAIWYQGENNQGRAHQYRTIFPAMINNWRTSWNQGDFPFYFVQLANFSTGDGKGWVELQEAQFLTYKKVANTGMAVINDIGDNNDIHPTNKRDVGKRLSLWALANTYGKELVYSGPLYKSIEVIDNTIAVSFDHVGGGLISKDGEALKYFEIAGEDQTYYPAQAKIEGDKVIVSSAKVEKPVAVRMGWNGANQPNLFNAEGLPASSFASEDWKRVTEGKE